ncbi:hypothetical protein COLO4_17249 [Corchorus olitorius]|uniref:Uncharacterized protein n=1 Tax=Corchorus olitorius TaxID=93759 RepID=A0A1R3JDJ2_9ROSI|nr:hypothetical protein COLO4_17249 [Corchorus olitorius]
MQRRLPLKSASPNPSPGPLLSPSPPSQSNQKPSTWTHSLDCSVHFHDPHPQPNLPKTVKGTGWMMHHACPPFVFHNPSCRSLSPNHANEVYRMSRFSSWTPLGYIF